MNARRLPELTDQQVELFWLKVDVRGEDECWPWVGSHDRNGYGKFGHGPKKHRIPVGAHRVVCLLMHGDPPQPGMLAMHTCDNPGCVNPVHIHWGTDGDNMRDMVVKGRGGPPDQRGEAHSRAQANETEVRAMRELFDAGATYQEVAAVFGYKRDMVSRICRRATWRHLL